MTAKFNLGQILITPAANEALDKVAVTIALKRHANGDYGLVSDADKEANDEALAIGDRILSAYESRGVRYWIITEADRSTTTILLPDEY